MLIAEVDKMSDKIKKAKEFEVHVVDEEFLDKIAKGNIVALIQQHSIAPWGADVSWALFGHFFVLLWPINFVVFQCSLSVFACDKIFCKSLLFCCQMYLSALSCRASSGL